MPFLAGFIARHEDRDGVGAEREVARCARLDFSVGIDVMRAMAS